MKHQYHLINNLTYGGAESIASMLAYSYSFGRLYTLLPYSSSSKLTFEQRYSVNIDNLFAFIYSYFVYQHSSFFTHNVQAHIVVNILNYLLTISRLRKRTHYNIIHFDSAQIKSFWRSLYFFSVRISFPRLIFVSSFSKKQYASFINLNKYNFHIIPNAIPSHFFANNPLPSLPPLIDKHITLGFIGRYSLVKRLDIALKVFNILFESSHAKVNFVIQSDITLNQLHELLFSLNLNSSLHKSITLIRHDEDTLNFYSVVDAVISTSLTETFSLIAIETLAMQKRFFSYNSPSISFILPDFKYDYAIFDILGFSQFIMKNLFLEYSMPNISPYHYDIFLHSYSLL